MMTSMPEGGARVIFTPVKTGPSMRSMRSSQQVWPAGHCRSRLSTSPMTQVSRSRCLRDPPATRGVSRGRMLSSA